MLKIISTSLIALAFVVSFSGMSNAAPNCTKGKPCGNSCIAQDKECHIPAAPAKQCTTGQLCGNTCISKDKKCTK
jgi:hypothetical protein